MDELLMRRRAAVDIKSKGPSFGGLMIAPGPLIYENGAFCISPDPYVSSYNSIYGKNEGNLNRVWSLLTCNISQLNHFL